LISEYVPEAEECINYSLPAFRYNGNVLIGYGASTKYCALYMFRSSILNQFEDDLIGYDFSKRTLRFPCDSPPPKELVLALIRARIKEITT